MIYWDVQSILSSNDEKRIYKNFHKLLAESIKKYYIQ